MKPRIIIDDNIPFIEGRLEGAADTVYTDQWGFTPELVRDADALIIRTRTRCDESLLEGSKVKTIATATIGTDQIDLDYCRRKGIRVYNAPGCNAPGVAQYVWSALLRSGFDPARHTLGIVGYGNVGSIVGNWGKKLGARILVNDPPKGMGGKEELAQLLRESDAVTLHTPLTRTGEHATYHLIGEQEIGLLRPGTLLVNAARGPVVEQEALKRRMARGDLRLVIDTWEFEPETDAELLEKAEYATFHIAGYSREGKSRATRMALEGIMEGLGIEADLTGLEGAYLPHERLTAQQIMDSYDPGIDTAALRAAPGEFDRLRREYDYRREVI